jgi:hypothetical protein
MLEIIRDCTDARPGFAIITSMDFVIVAPFVIITPAVVSTIIVMHAVNIKTTLVLSARTTHCMRDPIVEHGQDNVSKRRAKQRAVRA